MTQAELIRNAELTAMKLTGRPVVIRVRPIDGARGTTRKSTLGLATIDLDPAALKDPQAFCEVFTHELAHVKLHYADLPRSDTSASPRADIALANRLYKRPGSKIRKLEGEAEAQARSWRAVIDDHYRGYLLSCKDPYMAILKILYHEVKHGIG